MLPYINLINGYEITISKDYDFNKLQEQWLLLQQGQDLPFFLSWSWISCWLNTYKPEIIVVSARWANQTVAIGLFTRSIESRHGFVKSYQYRLHQMGDQLLDQIWMEYNDFLCVSKHKVPAVNACLLAMMQSDLKWSEIVVSMMLCTRINDIEKIIDDSHILLKSPCYATNLDNIKQDYDNFLLSLTSNTRYQIRRSIRLYKKLHGELELTLAQNTEEAIELFREAGRFHILRWKDSGYTNSRFIEFHENLINKSFAAKSVDLMRIMAGDTTIAILYFHRVGRDVYFYLQGINYESDKKLKPGLVAHAMANQYYMENGMRKYDYMGGYSQYKCQLSSHSQDLVTLCIQKPSIRFKIESMGSKVKHLFKKSARIENI